MLAKDDCDVPIVPGRGMETMLQCQQRLELDMPQKVGVQGVDLAHGATPSDAASRRRRYACVRAIAKRVCVRIFLTMLRLIVIVLRVQFIIFGAKCHGWHGVVREGRSQPSQIPLSYPKARTAKFACGAQTDWTI